VDQHGEHVLTRRAAVLVVRTVADAIRLHLVARGATGHDGVAVIFNRHVAALRQRQRLGQPLGVVLHAQRLGGVRAAALPGHKRVIFVAVESGHVLEHAGGNGV